MNLKDSGKIISLPAALFIVFLTLKLCDIGIVAKWSWWWVLSPLWIPPLIIGLKYLLYGLVLLVLMRFGVKSMEREPQTPKTPVMGDNEAEDRS